MKMYPISERELSFFSEPTRYQTVNQQRLIAEARGMQALALRNWFRRVFAGTVNAVRDFVIDPLVRLHKRQRMHDQLAHLDDRLLADIGIRRDEIAVYAELSCREQKYAPVADEKGTAASLHTLERRRSNSASPHSATTAGTSLAA